ncbi:MAG: hypothetical protein P9X24_15770 [Candidatus Hatepunaea meridiana]|nr:hypothetical protein [Candidatus Hatepunaea meridiana]
MIIIIMNLRRIYSAIFILSFSLLLFELTLIRVYSATLFYHFAFMAISVAMLGLAAAGLTVHLYPGKFHQNSVALWASRWSAAYAVSIFVVLWIVFRIPVNAYLPPDQVGWKLSIIYFLSAIPFYFAGLVFSGLFASMPKQIGGLYAWDLIGAGLGAVMMLLLMDYAGGESAGLYIMVAAFLAAVLFSWDSIPVSSSKNKPRRKLNWINRYTVSLFIALILAISNPYIGWLRIVYTKGQELKELNVLYNKWNSFSRIMAIPFRPGTETAQTWCPSPNYPFPEMEHLSIMIDDGASTPVPPFNGKDLEPIKYLKYDLTSLGHRMRGDGQTLIIGSGGGRDVLTGLLFDAKHIDAVDINPLIFDAMNGPLAKFTGNLYRHPKVKGIVAEGRAFARRHPQSYDLLQVAMIDTWAATTAGAYSLSENTLYTIEAFEDYLNALKPDGVLSFTRFFFYPPRQAIRLVSLFLETADRMGIESPEECILIGKYESLSTLLFKRSPFSNEEIALFKDDLNDLGFELVYSPDERPDKIFHLIVEVDDRSKFYDKYPFDVSPPDDDRPFFFNMLKMKDFLRVFEIREGQMFNYYATYTLLVVLILSVIATLIVLILPVILKSGVVDKFPGRWELLLYFIGIGLAYIMIEIALLQRFVLLLEHPAYAASGVVAGLLISSGLGSMLWGRTPPESRKRLLRIAFAVIGLTLLFQVFLGSLIIHKLIHLPIIVKALIAAVMIIPQGIAMGIPLPAGISVVGKYGSSNVAWCWALNGAASVVASSLAVTIAMAYGFASVLGFGLVCYVLAFSLMSFGFRRWAL